MGKRFSDLLYRTEFLVAASVAGEFELLHFGSPVFLMGMLLFCSGGIKRQGNGKHCCCAAQYALWSRQGLAEPLFQFRRWMSRDDTQPFYSSPATGILQF